MPPSGLSSSSSSSPDGAGDNEDKEDNSERESSSAIVAGLFCDSLFEGGWNLLLGGREGKRLEPEIQNDGTTQPGPALATAAALCQLGAAGAD